MAFEDDVLKLVKHRLDIMQTNTARDDYLTARIQSAQEELAGHGIELSEASKADQMLLADFVAWQYNNREEHLNGGGDMPKWLQVRTTHRAVQESVEDDVL